MSYRMQRVRELLRREIGEVIRREVPVDEAGLISVHEVAVSKDLKNATVFVSVLGGESQRRRALGLLDERRKLIQGIIGRAVVLKYTPQLRFVCDDAIERGDRVLKILQQIEPTLPPGEAPPKNP